ncbi:MAG: NAD(P)H-hydrate epimerase, partial [Pyrinomonadaceae bacterium]
MRPVISSAQMREVDRLTTERHGVASLELMENAATATARVTENFCGGVAGKRILVLCGKGNNGGDGAATARLLAMVGAIVDVLLLGSLEQTKGDARINFEKLPSRNEERALREDRGSAGDLTTINFFPCDSDKEWAQLQASVLSSPHDLVIDALFGTGLTRPVEGTHREAIAYMVRLRETSEERRPERPHILSIDIPSGLNADSGDLIGEAVYADATVTMTAPKPANVLPPAANYNGRLIVADIGSPAALIEEANPNLFLIEEADARRWLIQTRYQSDSFKNSHGHALIVAGSRGFTGAAALCANAAMRAGAGLVTVATPASVQLLVATQVMPEVMTASLAETDRGTVSDQAVDYFLKLSERAQVVAIGPGLSSDDDRTRAFAKAVVEQRSTPVVIDADGLNCLSPWPVELRGSKNF